MAVSMGRLTTLSCAIWMVLNTVTGSTIIPTKISTSNHTASNQTSVLLLQVSTYLSVQPHSLPVTTIIPYIIKPAANVPLVTLSPYASSVITTTTIVPIRVTYTITKTYYLTLFPSPSTTVTIIDYQCTTAVTQCASKSGTMAYNLKQANSNTAAGVVGGLIGGSIIGSVLTVVITAVAAILITKHHKKGKGCHQSRYIL